MLEPMQKTTEDFQKMGKDNYDAMLRAYGEVNKGPPGYRRQMDRLFQARFRGSDTRMGGDDRRKSLEHATEIQSNDAKNALIAGWQRHRRSARYTPPPRATPISRSSRL